MLTDLCRNKDIIPMLGQLMQALKRVLRANFHLALSLGEAQAVDPTPLLNLLPPALQRARVKVQRLGASKAYHVFENVSRITHNWKVDQYVLVD